MPEVVLPFKYVGGDPAVDLVNTVDWTSAGLKDERLGDYQRLTRWADPDIISMLFDIVIPAPEIA